jgi:hypothetical protein
MTPKLRANPPEIKDLVEVAVPLHEHVVAEHHKDAAAGSRFAEPGGTDSGLRAGHPKDDKNDVGVPARPRIRPARDKPIRMELERVAMLDEDQKACRSRSCDRIGKPSWWYEECEKISHHRTGAGL